MATKSTRNTYVAKMLGRDYEILAWDGEDAYRYVSRMMQRMYPAPRTDEGTYWLPCRLYDAQTGRLLQSWSEPVSWPGELTEAYATGTYYLVVDGYDTEFIAANNDEARERGRRLLHEVCGPNRGFETRFIEARVENTDGDIINEWTETLEAESPDCDAPDPDLAAATAKVLGQLLGVDAREDDGHAWANPFTASESICLRCGTARTDAGYEPGRYAEAVREVWRTAHPER